MPQHNFEPLRGRLTTLQIASKHLEGNLLGDPATRQVAVYLPPDYDDASGPYPLLLYLASFTGSGLKKIGWQLFSESIPQRIERLTAEGKIGPMIVAFPDGFTSLGGNQYINSIAMGAWEDYLIREMLPRLESDFRIHRDAAHRAVVGFSSGGYGALIQGMRHARHWAAVACHSPDMGFENLFRGDFPKVMTTLARYQGVAGFLADVESCRQLAGHQLETLMLLAMAATYDPDPTAFKGIRLPVDPSTCRLDKERWACWLQHDPVELVKCEKVQRNLADLKLFFFDCGEFDQYHLHYGARQLSATLTHCGILHRYEEFPDNHSGIEYRLDKSLPLLFEAIA